MDRIISIFQKSVENTLKQVFISCCMWTEYWNALTMCGPLLFMTYYHYTLPVNICTKCMWVGLILHAPFSILYHLLCANRVFHDNVNNIPRKMDQVMIHIGATAVILGISKYEWYTHVAIIFNELSISYICYAYSTPQLRRLNIFISVLFYIAPVFYDGYYHIGMNVLWYWILGIYFFVYNDHFHGYGQGIFHLLLCGMFHHLHSYCIQ